MAPVYQVLGFAGGDEVMNGCRTSVLDKLGEDGTVDIFSDLDIPG